MTNITQRVQTRHTYKGYNILIRQNDKRTRWQAEINGVDDKSLLRHNKPADAFAAAKNLIDTAFPSTNKITWYRGHRINVYIQKNKLWGFDVTGEYTLLHSNFPNPIVAENQAKCEINQRILDAKYRKENPNGLVEWLTF